MAFFAGGLTGLSIAMVSLRVPQQHSRRDQIPDVQRNHVGGEQVNLIEQVVALFQMVGLELTEISGANPVRR